MNCFFVDSAPQRVQRLQPTKQWRIRHWWVRTREVLIQVVMRIDEPRRY